MLFLENLSQLQECPPPERGKESKAFELISNSRAKKKEEAAEHHSATAGGRR